jgi:hypothetical protein
MSERSGQRPTRARRNTRARRAPPPRTPRGILRDRLKRDPFLCMLCLGGLAFLTWAFALTWWVTGGWVALALALVCVAPAIGLIYLRDA